jgi:1-acyl-sn-glycerol-3-phosphate acyltransferase
LVANHPSPFDGHLLCALCPRQFYSFARAELFEMLLARFHFWSVGSIPVTVGGDNRAATDRAEQLLREGNMFVMLPESDVYPGKTLHHFHGSFMKLSLSTGAPILPVAIVGTEKAMEAIRPESLRDLRLNACDVWVHFLEPLLFNNPTLDKEQFSQDVEQVKETIQGKVWEIVA